MKIPSSQIKKIAVFRALQLGDMLCVIPALRALHYAYPLAEITLLGLPWSKTLVERFPAYIHSFIHFPGYPGLPEQQFDATSFCKFLIEIQEQQFDLVLQMQGNGFIVNPMVETFGAKYAAGFCKPGDYCHDKNLFVEYPEGIHEIERHLMLMQFLGIQTQSTALEFPLTQKDYDTFNDLQLPVSPQQYICVHPGSRGAWRQWPPAYFAKLANICSAHGLKVVLTGTAQEMDIVEKVAALLTTEPVIAAGKTTLGAAGVLLKNAALLISNCTGVSHMAAALQTPAVVISMDGEPERWAPLDKNLHRTIDWTTTPSFDLAVEALKDLLCFVQPDHSRDKMVMIAR